MKRSKKGRKLSDKEKMNLYHHFANEVITIGLHAISEKTGLPVGYLSHHINRSEIDKEVGNIMKKYPGTDFENLVHDKDFQEEVIEYVSGGKVLSDIAKKASGGLEDITMKETFWKKVARYFKGEGKEEETNYEGVKDLQRLISSDPNYSVALGDEIVGAVSAATKAHYAQTAVNVAAANKLIEPSLYNSLMSRTNKILSESHGAIKEGFSNLGKSLEDYIAGPKAGYATAAIGVLLIFLFNPIKATGSVVSVGGSFNNSILPFIGIGLLFVSGLSFIFRGRKLKK